MANFTEMARAMTEVFDTVDDADRCPVCGENRTTFVVWNDEEGVVECRTCGAAFAWDNEF